MNYDPSLAELAGTFAQIGQHLLATGEDAVLLDRLLATTVELVPGAQYAGITQQRNGGFTTPAATDDLVRVVDRIQYDLGGGPCVDAIEQGEVFNARDLRSDSRWPCFGRSAFEQAGILSMLSFRLFVEIDPQPVFGLNMYSREPSAFDCTSESIGLLLATHGALAFTALAARTKIQNLELALRTRTEIGVAMGILMARLKITRDEAFDLLRIASQHTHRKLSAVAVQVGDTGALPELPTDPASPRSRSRGR
jgi:ANTAR domain-containing protein/GAF domain-containing protein